jgi:hypothetical protein
MRDNPFADLIPQQPVNDSIGRKIGIGARGLVKSIGAIPDLLATPANIALAAQGKEPLLNLSEDIGKGFDYLTNNQFVPQTLGEKIIGTGAEFAGGGANIAKAGATKASQFAQKFLAPQSIRDYAALTSAGGGMEFGKELDPNSAVAPIVGSLAGAFAPGAALKTANFLGAPIKSTQNALASALSINPGKAQAFEDAGLMGTLGDISDSRFVKGAQNVNLEAPFSGNIIADSIKKTSDVIDSRLSPGLSQEEGGRLAQQGLRNYQSRAADITQKLSTNLKRHLAADENIPAINTLNNIASNRPNLTTPEAIQQFANSNIGKEYAKLENVAQRYNGAVPYEDLVYFRKQIDNEITTFGKYGDAEQRALKGLRTEIQNDIGAALKAKSPEAAKDFERFNKFYTQFARKNEEVVSKLLENKTATLAFRSIVNDLKVDAEKANTVIKTLKPEQKQVFTQSLVKELGMNPQNEFSPAYFATNFKKLEPNAQNVLLAPFSNETRKQIRATVDAIDSMKDTQAIANPSGTFNQALRGGAIVGAITQPFTTAAVLLGGNISARLMTSPKFLSWLAKAPGLKTAKDVSKHITNLERISKTLPQLTPDIQDYLRGLNAQEKLETPAAPVNNTNPFDDLIPQAQQAAPQAPPQLESLDQGPVTPELLNKISFIESGNNPNARSKTSTASGAFQFTNATWREGVKKYGAETGVKLTDKNNPNAQRIIAEKMLGDNAEILANNLGRSPNDTEVYLTHFLGLEGAKKLLESHPQQFAARVFPEAAKANRALFFNKGQPLTVAQLYDVIDKKVRGA